MSIEHVDETAWGEAWRNPQQTETIEDIIGRFALRQPSDEQGEK